jgi:hypothetical protein
MVKSLMTMGCVAFVGIALGYYLAPAHSDPVQRGDYLVKALGCASCHTPILGTDEQALAGHPEGEVYPSWSPDFQARNISMVAGTSGTAFAGPWGVSFAANLTPDDETGLGTWTEDMFFRALRTGKHRGEPQGRKLYPPMTMTAGVLMHGAPVASDEDLKAIWAYLRQLPPFRNRVPAPLPLPEGRS